MKVVWTNAYYIKTGPIQSCAHGSHHSLGTSLAVHLYHYWEISKLQLLYVFPVTTPHLFRWWNVCKLRPLQQRQLSLFPLRRIIEMGWNLDGHLQGYCVTCEAGETKQLKLQSCKSYKLSEWSFTNAELCQLTGLRPVYNAWTSTSCARLWQ